jgi:hypothetical protein
VNQLEFNLQHVIALLKHLQNVDPIQLMLQLHVERLQLNNAKQDVEELLQIFVQTKIVMITVHAQLIHAILQMANVFILQTTLLVMILTNVPLIDVHQMDALILQLFVTTEMHVPLIDVIHQLVLVFMLQKFALKLIVAQFHLVTTKLDASINQNLVMTTFHAQLILAFQTVVAQTLQLTHFVMITMHVPLINVLQDKDVLILQLFVTIIMTALLINVLLELANTSSHVMTTIHAQLIHATKTLAVINKRLVMTTTNVPLIHATNQLEDVSTLQSIVMTTMHVPSILAIVN